MKKIILILLALFISLPTFAYVTNTTKSGEFEKMTHEIGYKLLNANKIPYNITFSINKRNIVNACSKYNNKSIVVYKDLFNYLENEDELAGILAHEISHSVDYSQGAFKGYFSVISTNLAPKKYEYKADKRAVDYVVKAGYNPLGIITAVQKIASQPRYDWYLSHPLTSKRTATVYEYIYTKYPEYLVQNEYKDNLVYQNFLLTSKENRKKLEKKVSSGSKKQIKYQ